MAPIAVGLETDGSLVTASIRTTLDIVKPTYGLAGGTNLISTRAPYDTSGPMGKTVKNGADPTTFSWTTPRPRFHEAITNYR